MSAQILLVLISLALSQQITSALRLQTTPSQGSAVRRFGSMGGQRWGDFEGFECKVIGPVATMQHLGDYTPHRSFDDDVDSREKIEFNLNLGKAMEVLRKQLPHVFIHGDLDFSIFANQITVTDTRNNKFAMQKSLYMGAVKSLRMASSLSSIYPAMNVRKIEYIEECQAIHCLVDVLLPDAIRVDGQAAWEGSFFFGLDTLGLINAHTFDRKITNLRPNPLLTSSYPWLQATPQWAEDLLAPAPVPKRGLVTSFTEAVTETNQA